MNKLGSLLTVAYLLSAIITLTPEIAQCQISSYNVGPHSAAMVRRGNHWYIENESPRRLKVTYQVNKRKNHEYVGVWPQEVRPNELYLLSFDFSTYIVTINNVEKADDDQPSPTPSAEDSMKSLRDLASSIADGKFANSSSAPVVQRQASTSRQSQRGSATSIAGVWQGIYTGKVVSGPPSTRGAASPVGKSESTPVTVTIDAENRTISVQGGSTNWTRSILSLGSSGGTAENGVSFSVAGNQMILNSTEELQGFTIRGRAVLSR